MRQLSIQVTIKLFVNHFFVKIFIYRTAGVEKEWTETNNVTVSKNQLMTWPLQKKVFEHEQAVAMCNLNNKNSILIKMVKC